MTRQPFAINHAIRCHDNSDGSALIAVIASILLFSVLSATLLPMVSSSGTQVAFTSLADKAYALAESGYRLLDSRYRNAGSEALGYAELDYLEDANFTLDDNNSRTHLNIYSYFFRITAIDDASNQITIDPPGTTPLDTDITSNVSPLQIGNQLYTIISVTPNGEGGNFTLTVSPPLDAQIAIDDIVYPATRTAADGTLDFINGFAQNLPYKANEGALFPLRNGTIRISSHVLKYRYNDRANNQFKDLNDPYAPADGDFNYTYAAGDTISLTNVTTVHSTGKVGGGSFVAEREVIYFDALPLSASARPRPTVEDKFNDPEQKWNPQDVIGAIDPEGDGNTAATITENESSTSGLATLKTDETQEAFDSLRRITGNYIGYDAQIKVGFNPAPEDNQAPIPFPVAAGLSFRLSEVAEGSTTQYNGYGLSFVSGNATAEDGSDLLGDIIPEGQEDQSLIVLWQQTVDGSDVERNWLAYKQLKPIETIFDNDDTHAQNWEKVDPSDDSFNRWNIESTGAIRFPAQGEIGQWYYRGGIQYPKSDGNVTTTDDWIQLCPEADKITLNYTSEDNTDDADIKRVKITVRDGTAFPDCDGTDPPCNLSLLAGKEIRIQFYFNRESINLIPYYYYWEINDIAITCEEFWPAQNSTLLVRLQEAALVKFTDGGTPASTAPLAIENGDWVRGDQTQTRATVVGIPILSGGNWTTDDAEGTLLLNDIVDGSGGDGFNIGETLHVMNRSGGIQAKVTAYSNDDDRKVNVIKAYYGSADRRGTENDDPLDGNMTAYGRLEADEILRWPPDENEPWTQETDYFRLIQWDAINDDNTSTLDVGIITSVETPDAILRTHEAKLQSPATGQPSPSPEFGLHTYGAGAGQTYFDDFGFQLIFPPADVFATPLQQ